MPTLRVPRSPGNLSSAPAPMPPVGPPDPLAAPASIDWATTRAVVEARLAALAADDPYARALTSALHLLTMAGAVYDDRFTPDHRRAVAAEELAYAADLAAWRASVAPLFAKVDRVARELERRQLAASAGVTLDPRIATLPDGRQLVLAPEPGAAMALPSDYNDEPDAAARLVLVTAGLAPVPILRLTARAVGRAGGRVEARVEDVPGFATRFLLSVRLGGYVETWKPLDTSAPWSTRSSQPPSRLVAPLAQVGHGRPATMGWTPLAGGSGQVREGVEDRARDALALPATGEVERRLMEATLKAFSGAWAYKREPPLARAGTASRALAETKATLLASIERAQAMLALLDALEATP